MNVLIGLPFANFASPNENGEAVSRGFVGDLRLGNGANVVVFTSNKFHSLKGLAYVQFRHRGSRISLHDSRMKVEHFLPAAGPFGAASP